MPDAAPHEPAAAASSASEPTRPDGRGRIEVVVLHGPGLEADAGEQPCGGPRLGGASLEDQAPSRGQPLPHPGDDTPVEGEAIVPAVEAAIGSWSRASGGIMATAAVGT